MDDSAMGRVQRAPVLFWISASAALVAMASARVHEATLAGALWALCPFLFALACSGLGSPRWVRGIRGFLLSVPLVISIPYHLYLMLAVPAGKWAALHLLWSTQLFGLSLAIWWLAAWALDRFLLTTRRRGGRCAEPSVR